VLQLTRELLVKTKEELLLCSKGLRDLRPLNEPFPLSEVWKGTSPHLLLSALEKAVVAATRLETLDQKELSALRVQLLVFKKYAERVVTTLQAKYIPQAKGFFDRVKAIYQRYLNTMDNFLRACLGESALLDERKSQQEALETEQKKIEEAISTYKEKQSLEGLYKEFCTAGSGRASKAANALEDAFALLNRLFQAFADNISEAEIQSDPELGKTLVERIQEERAEVEENWPQLVLHSYSFFLGTQAYAEVLQAIIKDYIEDTLVAIESVLYRAEGEQ